MRVNSRSNIVEFRTSSEKETEVVASRLVSKIRHRDIVGLTGDLGVGKTAFARAFINAFPGDPEEVLSPTFPIVQIYERTGVEIYHFDLFRLEYTENTDELGIEDAFNDAISLIEWPDRLGPLLPKSSLIVEINLLGGATERLIKFLGSSMWSHRLEDI